MISTKCYIIYLGVCMISSFDGLCLPHLTLVCCEFPGPRSNLFSVSDNDVSMYTCVCSIWKNLSYKLNDTKNFSNWDIGHYTWVSEIIFYTEFVIIYISYYISYNRFSVFNIWFLIFDYYVLYFLAYIVFYML